MKFKEKVCVIGLWHLGAVTSGCLADVGYEVYGIDNDPNRVEVLINGKLPLYEPGLEELIKKMCKMGRLKFTHDYKEALNNAKHIVVAYDTPIDENDDVDLSIIFESIENSIPFIENDSLIIISSQIPLGTCEKLQEIINKEKPTQKIDIVYSPENLKLGEAIKRFMNPAMIVIGSNDDSAREKADDFFSFIGNPKLFMDWRSSEMTKHCLNAFLATCISFANELGNICDRTGADAYLVSSALRYDERVGPKAMIFPGLGFSGGTLARDVKILQHIAKKCNYVPKIINSVLAVNQEQNRTVVQKLGQYLGPLKNRAICVLGITYKPGTSTLRRSAALEIIDELVKFGAKVKAYDPKADLSELKSPKKFDFFKNPYDAVQDCDALVLVTAWPEFRELNFKRIKEKMNEKFIFDTQNFLDREYLIEKGFSYLGIGRGKFVGGR